jgi:Fic family protein
MLSLRVKTFLEARVPVATGWLLGECLEAKGKQELWLKSKPEALKALRERAMVQSVESSNRIEGVVVEKSRLSPLALGRARPKDRSEEELAGYRKALEWIYGRKRPVPIAAKTILFLHELAQGGMSGDAGEWKRRDNEIVEILPTGGRKVRFKPVSAKETPALVKKLCLGYSETASDDRIPKLLVGATFVFDFLCIHPFRDGNGRVSRLLWTLLLIQDGYEVGRYISLERLIEEDKEEYYKTLAHCSRGWHSGANELLPWWNYSLSILRRAYRELASQVESLSSHGSKSDMVRQAISSQIGPFSLAELKAANPSASAQLIKQVLAAMKAEGKLKLKGRGRGALWVLTKQ